MLESMLYMKNKTTIIAAFIGIVVVIAAAWLFFRSSGSNDNGTEGVDKDQVVVADSPINVALDFYESWLNALQSTSTNPYQSGLAKADVLSKQLRAKLVASEGHDATVVDPVTCQLAVPSKFRTKSLYELEDKAQVLVLAKGDDKDLNGQAVVTLVHLNEGWYIDDITCSAGDVAPKREFTFEKDGFLLKSVVAPLDPKYWHLVFEENGQFGHATPLFFNAESVCTDIEGNTGVCEPDKFMETSKALIKGQMNESGVEVIKLEMVK